MTNTSEQLRPVAEPTTRESETGPRSIRDIIRDLSQPIAPRHLKTKPATRQGGQLTYIEWHTAVKYLDHHASGTKAANLTAAKPKEPFSLAAQRLGDALADVITHPNCPADVEDAISELDCRIFNHYSDVEINLRHGLAQRLVGMLERPA